MSSYLEKWEAARKTYVAKRDHYYSSHEEADLEEANKAFRTWLATSMIFVRENRPPLRSIGDLLNRLPK